VSLSLNGGFIADIKQISCVDAGLIEALVDAVINIRQKISSHLSA